MVGNQNGNGNFSGSYDNEDRALWPLAPITVNREARTVTMRRQLTTGAGVVEIEASDLHPSREGIRAKVGFFHNGALLAYDVLAVLRHDSRKRLVVDAHEQLGKIFKTVYPLWVMQNDLAVFGLAVDKAEGEFYQVEDLEGSPHKLQFYLEPYIVRGAGTILFAPPGSTKSYLAMAMAVSIDSGSTAIWPVTQVPVLYINLERGRESMAGRLYRINQALGLRPERPLTMINARGKTMAQVAKVAERAISERGIQVTMLDSISRAGGDLNDNKDANAVMDMLNSYGIAWGAIGHTPRADSHRMGGSQMFDAAADLMLEIQSERRGNTTGVMLKMQKFNDVPPRSPELLAFDFDDDGLVHIRRPRSGEFTELNKDATRKQDLVSAIAAVLPVGGGLTAKAIYDALIEDGVETTQESVRATLNKRRGDLFKSWKQDFGGGAGVPVWGFLER